MRRIHARLFLAAVFVAASAGQLHAATIRVSPGAGTPLQDAIALAQPGDIIRVAGGLYSGPIVVDKAIRIVGDRLSVQVDAGCGVPNALEVTADGADIRNLRLDGGSINGVVVEGRDRVRLRNMGIFDTCNATGAGVRLVGVTKLNLRNVRGGIRPIGTYVADLVPGAQVTLSFCGGEGTPFGGMDTGVLAENIGPGALKLVRCQIAYAADAGVDLRNADGVRIGNSVIIGQGVASSSRGIVVDADSSDNTIVRNVIRANQVDVVDLGPSNCWRGNGNPGGLPPLSGNASTLGCP